MAKASGRHDLAAEGLLSLGDLAKLVARDYGVDRCWHTWFKWQSKAKDPKTGEYLYGARRWDGRKVFLESCYVGGTIHSSEAAWLRFHQAQNEGRE